MSLALPLTGGQNLAVMVLRMLARHMGQRAPAAMMPLAQPWQVHCRGATGSQCGYSLPVTEAPLAQKCNLCHSGQPDDLLRMTGQYTAGAAQIYGDLLAHQV